MKSYLLVLACVIASGCVSKPAARMETPSNSARDPHSYSNPDKLRVEHADLNLTVSFEKREFAGDVVLTLKRAPRYSGPLVLDTRTLNITKAESSADGNVYRESKFTLGTHDKIFGAPLTIETPADAKYVRVSYSTSPQASGLLWLMPAQTAGKKHPFVFSQGQPIHTRSWIPLQDTPAVRMTYTARIHTPKELLAVMSAENDPNPPARGDYHFKMPQPISSYLIALAVGDLAFESLGPRSGVYAEKPVVKKAAKELEDTEKMISAAESLYGPYAWGRYDLLILPPSFPFGGMENPRLTFATPTILAGDKSLVALVSHELAHSWSGNLVTNATWRDFWLNEGFTTYFERRIQEKVYGRERSEMEAMIERSEMLDEMKQLQPRDQILHVDLNGRDPDEGFTQIPYVKGMLFLRLLEETYGRETFDAFLKGYFDQFKFQTITTEQFLSYLRAHLPDVDKKVNLEEWITQAGLPASAPKPTSDRLAKVEQQAKDWIAGKTTLAALPSQSWTTHEWLHFLQALPEKLDSAKMAELDRAFKLTQVGNYEILHQWLMMSVRNGYKPAYARLEHFLLEVGRRKFIKPLYQELAKTPEGKAYAAKVYERAKPSYQSMVQSAVEDALK